MQTDLFEIPVDTPASQAGKFAFLERYRFSIRLDQALAATILFIMIYVFVFSFGVEKGKQFAMAELQAERTKREHMVQELRDKLIENKVFPGHPEEAPVSALSKTQIVIETQKAVMTNVAPKVEKKKVRTEVSALTTKNSKVSPKAYPQGKYTIQMVTYKSQAIADRALGELLKKGIPGFIIPKGSNLQVCVNAFESEGQAKQALGQLKSQGIIPSDSFIRTIPQP